MFIFDAFILYLTYMNMLHVNNNVLSGVNHQIRCGLCQILLILVLKCIRDWIDSK